MNRSPLSPALTARLAHDPQLAPRWAAVYAHLRALPRHLRQRLRRARLSLAAAALLLALGGAPRLAPLAAAPAVIITVANGEVDLDDNGLCSLVEAIDNANDTTDGRGDEAGHDDCAAGNPAGADIVALPAGGAFTLTDYTSYDYGYTALPLITSTITISGNGSTLQRTGGDELRFLAASGADLTLDHVTLQGGQAGDYYGGAVYAIDSTLTLTNCTLSGNKAARGGALAVNGGAATITNSTLRDNDSDKGGAIYAYDAELALQTSTLSGNDAGAGQGGGVYSYAGRLALTGATVR
ncbi:MAG TPA: hypothetical protein PK829_11965, partial [Promineifilum sp.]|nr:hypothetical protein [Promineifilum sp.]